MGFRPPCLAHQIESVRQPREMSMKSLGIAVLILVTSSVKADEWVVRGQLAAPAYSSQCAVANAADGPPAVSFPNVLKKVGTRKAACEFAKATKSEDGTGSDAKMCGDYTTASKAHCTAERIQL
jgi:hypothetical protein